MFGQLLLTFILKVKILDLLNMMPYDLKLKHTLAHDLYLVQKAKECQLYLKNTQSQVRELTPWINSTLKEI